MSNDERRLQRNELESGRVDQPLCHQFNIPKINPSGFTLRDVEPESQEETEAKKIMVSSRLFPNSTSIERYELEGVQVVHNTHLAERFAEKKAEMRDQGCSSKDLEEHFLFSTMQNSSKAFAISKFGLRCHVLGKFGSKIGNDLKGVYVQKYSDVLMEDAARNTFYGSDVWVLVYKGLYGKIKYVPERRSDLMVKKVIPYTPALDPTPNHNCHMVQPSSTTPKLWHHKSNTVSGMVYLYEYDDDCQPVLIPRQLLPIYVMKYTKTAENNTSTGSAFDSPPVLYESPKKPLGPHTPPNTPPHSPKAAQVVKKRNSDAENISTNPKRPKMTMSLSDKFGVVKQVSQSDEIKTNKSPTKGTYGEYLQCKAEREAKLLKKNKDTKAHKKPLSAKCTLSAKERLSEKSNTNILKHIEQVKKNHALWKLEMKDKLSSQKAKAFKKDTCHTKNPVSKESKSKDKLPAEKKIPRISMKMTIPNDFESLMKKKSKSSGFFDNIIKSNKTDTSENDSKATNNEIPEDSNIEHTELTLTSKKPNETNVNAPELVETEENTQGPVENEINTQKEEHPDTNIVQQDKIQDKNKDSDDGIESTLLSTDVEGKEGEDVKPPLENLVKFVPKRTCPIKQEPPDIKPSLDSLFPFERTQEKDDDKPLRCIKEEIEDPEYDKALSTPSSGISSTSTTPLTSVRPTAGTSAPIPSSSSSTLIKTGTSGADKPCETPGLFSQTSQDKTNSDKEGPGSEIDDKGDDQPVFPKIPPVQRMLTPLLPPFIEKLKKSQTPSAHDSASVSNSENETLSHEDDLPEINQASTSSIKNKETQVEPSKVSSNKRRKSEKESRQEKNSPKKRRLESSSSKGKTPDKNNTIHQNNLPHNSAHNSAQKSEGTSLIDSVEGGSRLLNDVDEPNIEDFMNNFEFDDSRPSTPLAVQENNAKIKKMEQDIAERIQRYKLSVTEDEEEERARMEMSDDTLGYSTSDTEVYDSTFSVGPSDIGSTPKTPMSQTLDKSPRLNICKPKTSEIQLVREGSPVTCKIKSMSKKQLKTTDRAMSKKEEVRKQKNKELSGESSKSKKLSVLDTNNGIERDSPKVKDFSKKDFSPKESSKQQDSSQLVDTSKEKNSSEVEDSSKEKNNSNEKISSKEKNSVKVKDLSKTKDRSKQKHSCMSKREDFEEKNKSNKKDVSKEKDTSHENDLTKERNSSKMKDSSKVKCSSKEKHTPKSKESSKEKYMSKEKDCTKKKDITKVKDLPKERDTSEEKKKSSSTKKSSDSSKIDSSKQKEKEKKIVRDSNISKSTSPNIANKGEKKEKRKDTKISGHGEKRITEDALVSVEVSDNSMRSQKDNSMKATKTGESTHATNKPEMCEKGASTNIVTSQSEESMVSIPDEPGETGANINNVDQAGTSKKDLISASEESMKTVATTSNVDGVDQNSTNEENQVSVADEPAETTHRSPGEALNLNKVQKICETANSSMFNAVQLLKEIEETLIGINRQRSIQDDDHPTVETQTNVEADDENEKDIDDHAGRKFDETKKANSIEEIDFGLAAKVAKDPYNTALILASSKSRGRRRGMAKRGGMGRGMLHYRATALVHETDGEDGGMSSEELDAHYDNAYKAINRLKGHKLKLPSLDKDQSSCNSTQQKSPREDMSQEDIDMRPGRELVQQEPAVISPFHAHLSNSIKQGNWDTQAHHRAEVPTYNKLDSDPYMQAIDDIDYSKNKEIITIQTLQETLEKMPQDDACKSAMQLSIDTLISKLPNDCKEYLDRCKKERSGSVYSSPIDNTDHTLTSNSQWYQQTESLNEGIAHFPASIVPISDVNPDGNISSQGNDDQDVKKTFCHDETSKDDLLKPVDMETSDVDEAVFPSHTEPLLPPVPTTPPTPSQVKELPKLTEPSPSVIKSTRVKLLGKIRYHYTYISDSDPITTEIQKSSNNSPDTVASTTPYVPTSSMSAADPTVLTSTCASSRITAVVTSSTSELSNTTSSALTTSETPVSTITTPISTFTPDVTISRATMPTSTVTVTTITTAISTSTAAVLTSTTAVLTSTTAVLKSIAGILTSTPAVSTSTSVVSTSIPVLSNSTAAVSTSTSAVSTSIPSLSTSVAAVSTSTSAVSTSIPSLSTSVAAVSTSTSAVSTSIPSLSTSVAAVSISTASASVSLSTGAESNVKKICTVPKLKPVLKNRYGRTVIEGRALDGTLLPPRLVPLEPVLVKGVQVPKDPRLKYSKFHRRRMQMDNEELLSPGSSTSRTPDPGLLSPKWAQPVEKQNTVKQSSVAPKPQSSIKNEDLNDSGKPLVPPEPEAGGKPLTSALSGEVGVQQFTKDSRPNDEEEENDSVEVPEVKLPEKTDSQKVADMFLKKMQMATQTLPIKATHPSNIEKTKSTARELSYLYEKHKLIKEQLKAEDLAIQLDKKKVVVSKANKASPDDELIHFEESSSSDEEESETDERKKGLLKIPNLRESPPRRSVSRQSSRPNSRSSARSNSPQHSQKISSSRHGQKSGSPKSQSPHRKPRSNSPRSKTRRRQESSDKRSPSPRYRSYSRSVSPRDRRKQTSGRGQRSNSPPHRRRSKRSPSPDTDSRSISPWRDWKRHKGYVRRHSPRSSSYRSQSPSNRHRSPGYKSRSPGYRSRSPRSPSPHKNYRPSQQHSKSPPRRHQSVFDRLDKDFKAQHAFNDSLVEIASGIPLSATKPNVLSPEHLTRTGDHGELAHETEESDNDDTRLVIVDDIKQEEIPKKKFEAVHISPPRDDLREKLSRPAPVKNEQYNPEYPTCETALPREPQPPPPGTVPPPTAWMQPLPPQMYQHPHPASGVYNVNVHWQPHPGHYPPTGYYSHPGDPYQNYMYRH